MKDAVASKWIFLGGIAVSLLLGIVAQVVAMTGAPRVAAGVGALAAVVCGVVFLRYPFATPETVSILGVRRSERLVRIFGVLILALAAYLIVLAVAPS